jgi:hypothetical protein
MQGEEEMKVKVIEVTEVDCCKECPNFDYENGKGVCYDRGGKEVEDEDKIDMQCRFRKKRKKK